VKHGEWVAVRWRKKNASAGGMNDHVHEWFASGLSNQPHYRFMVFTPLLHATEHKLQLSNKFKTRSKFTKP
jgi:hypothetical protein